MRFATCLSVLITLLATHQSFSDEALLMSTLEHLTEVASVEVHSFHGEFLCKSHRTKGQTSTTEITRKVLWWSNGRHRTDSTDLSQPIRDTGLMDKTLQELSGLPIPPQQATTINVWTGEKTLSLLPPPPSHLGQKNVLPLIAIVPAETAFPRIDRFGREIALAPMFLDAKAAGEEVSCEAVHTEDGEEGIKITRGAPGTVHLLFEAIVLPSKGYVLQKSTLRKLGAIQAREEYGAFVQVPMGLWFPQISLQETYQLLPNGVASIAGSDEYFAVSPLEVNGSIEDSVFDIKPNASVVVVQPTSDPDSRDLSVSLSKAQKLDSRAVGQSVSKSMSGLVLFNALAIVALVFWFVLSYRRSKRNV